MTTIGYGDYAPKTNGGKVFTFFFTIISVPLFVVALAHLSSMLAKAAEAVFREYHDRFCNNKNSYVPGIVSLGLFFLLVLSVGFSASQSDWSYLDACYFSIISFDHCRPGRLLAFIGQYKFLGLHLIFMVGTFTGRSYHQ
ncbi:unnamed protein product [Heterosigma akashiwo]